MSTYARMVGGVAVDIITTDPAQSFVPELAAQFIPAPDGTQQGAKFDGKIWTAPAPANQTPAQDVGAVVTPPEFKLLFTSPERIAIYASDDPVVIDFLRIIDDPRLTEVKLGLQSTQDALAYLASKSLIAADRVAEISTGQIH